MRPILIPFRPACNDTVPVTLVSRVWIFPFAVQNFSGSRKFAQPTCWIGTRAPSAAFTASIMSGNVAR